MGTPTRFDRFEIWPVREWADPEDGAKLCETVTDPAIASYWSLYGHVPGAGVVVIGDFATHADAYEVYCRLPGDVELRGPVKP